MPKRPVIVQKKATEAAPSPARKSVAPPKVKGARKSINPAPAAAPAATAPSKAGAAKPTDRKSIVPGADPRLIKAEQALADAEVEMGRLLAHSAKLEQELRDLRALKASAAQVSLPPAAVHTLSEGLEFMRETLLDAAARLDRFTRREFDLFDPKARTLLEVRTVLLRAAGENAKLPPPVPVPVIDITDMAEALESLRPATAVAPRKGDSIRIPAHPKVRLDK